MSWHPRGYKPQTRTWITYYIDTDVINLEPTTMSVSLKEFSDHTERDELARLLGIEYTHYFIRDDYGMEKKGDRVFRFDTTKRDGIGEILYRLEPNEGEVEVFPGDNPAPKIKKEPPPRPVLGGQIKSEDYVE